MELKGNDSYKTSFKTVSLGDEKGNGVTYGTPDLIVMCPKATVYVNGALYKKVGELWNLVQVDMVMDDKATEVVENTCKFELIKPNGEYFDTGHYMIKIVADGRNKWTDKFIIGEQEVKRNAT